MRGDRTSQAKKWPKSVMTGGGNAEGLNHATNRDSGRVMTGGGIAESLNPETK